jgi:hypothetical protein
MDSPGVQFRNLRTNHRVSRLYFKYVIRLVSLKYIL